MVYQSPEENERMINKINDELREEAEAHFNNLIKKNKKVKKVKKGKGSDDIVIPKKEFISEHKNLVSLIAKLAVEGKKQKKELKNVIKSKKGGKLNDCPSGFTTYPLTCTNWKTGQTIGRVNVAETNKEIENTFKKLGDDILVVLNKEKEFYENVGRGLLHIFNIPEELWIENVYKPIDDKFKETIYNADWWKKTMSDPKTYICLISYALKLASVLGCGPGCAYAGENLKNIGYLIVDLSNGKNPSTEQVFELFMGLIPEAGAFHGEEGLKEELEKGVLSKLKTLSSQIEGISEARRASLVAKNLFEAGQGVKSAYEFAEGQFKTEAPEVEDKKEVPEIENNKEAEKDVIVQDSKDHINIIKKYSDDLNNLFDKKTNGSMTEYEYTTDINGMVPQLLEELKFFKNGKYMPTVDLHLKDTELKSKIVEEYKKIKTGGKKVKDQKNDRKLLGGNIPDLTPDYSHYPKDSHHVLEKIGKYKIDRIQLVRRPVRKYVQQILHIISLGYFDKARQEQGYDHFFHLSMIVDLTDEAGNLYQIFIDKAPRIEIYDHLPESKLTEDAEYISVGHPDAVTTLYEMLENTRLRVGDTAFFSYDGFSNNCQGFLKMLLQTVGLWSERAKKFTYQDSVTTLSKLPYLSQELIKAIPVFANIYDSKIKGNGEPDDDVKKLYNYMNLDDKKLFKKIFNEIPDDFEKLCSNIIIHSVLSEILRTTLYPISSTIRSEFNKILDNINIDPYIEEKLGKNIYCKIEKILNKANKYFKLDVKNGKRKDNYVGFGEPDQYGNIINPPKKGIPEPYIHDKGIKKTKKKVIKKTIKKKK
jgi:hypothetical protein